MQVGLFAAHPTGDDGDGGSEAPGPGEGRAHFSTDRREATDRSLPDAKGGRLRARVGWTVQQTPRGPDAGLDSQDAGDLGVGGASAPHPPHLLSDVTSW